MVKKQKSIIFILLLFILLLIPLNIGENNYQNDLIFSIHASNQASASGNITEAEVAIQNAYEKLLEAESIGIVVITLSTNLQGAIDILNLAIKLNDSGNLDFDSVIGNATIAKNSANQIISETIQLINNVVIFTIIVLIVIVISIAVGIFIFTKLFLKRLRKKTDEEFLKSTIIKKEDKN